MNITGIGGVEQNVPGSFRLLYSDRPFGQSNLPDIATIDFSADVALTCTTSDYETQFVIVGNGIGNGQVGVELHYQAGPKIAFGQNRINTTTINFPAGSGITGQQYYSVNTKAPKVNKGQTVHLQVKYFDSGFMQAFAEGQLVGQFKTKLVAEKGAYILHDTTNRGTTFMKNILVLNNGIDITQKGVPSFSTDPLTITNGSVSATYFHQ